MGKNFNGTLKEALIEMLKNETDCCEVSYAVDDMIITSEITITRVVKDGELLYDATTPELPDEDEVDYTEDDEEIIYS